MLAIVPTKGAFASFEAGLTGSKVLDVLASLEEGPLYVSLPKMKVEADFHLVEPLRALGMVRAFGPADFSGMNTEAALFVDDVVHETFAEIDEKGTEAAAATGVIINSSATPTPELRIDRPFILAIVDRPTRSIVFLGRVLEPKL